MKESKMTIFIEKKCGGSVDALVSDINTFFNCEVINPNDNPIQRWLDGEPCDIHGQEFLWLGMYMWYKYDLILTPDAFERVYVKETE